MSGAQDEPGAFVEGGYKPQPVEFPLIANFLISLGASGAAIGLLWAWSRATWRFAAQVVAPAAGEVKC